ncbi:hypothetical protein GLOIN_2v882189 [Rhizophagus clarus]|uniref:Uncharacterized protein n=1 Tax=Rhizophagus clarus TaxID=94130 RepID=A0A8H3L0W8_9GLOM|nr:hypothetical protein GLOIN_2v882189 [Rhizophagus clarus]
MVTFVLHDHMTHDAKKLLQQSSVKKFFSFVNFLLNSPSTPHQLSHQKISSTGLRLKENCHTESTKTFQSAAN